MDKDQLLSKVRKCLALGNNEGASPAERERALAQASKLLAGANLTMASVTQTVEERVQRAHAMAKHLQQWPTIAIAGVAKLFFCTYYREPSTGKYYYVGKAVNVSATQMMVEYVLVNIIKEAKKRASAAKASELIHGEAMSGTGYGKEWEYSFCRAAAEEVERTCRRLIAERERDGIQSEAGSGTALVVVSLAKSEKAANDAMLAKLGVVIKLVSVDPGSHAGARLAGAAHGKTISLAPQVGVGPKPIAIAHKGS